MYFLKKKKFKKNIFFNKFCDGTPLLKGGDTMRNGLYMFRHGKRLSQAEMAAKIGCNRATYAAVESGKRDGRMTFWNNLKKAFGVSDADIGGLMRVDEEQTQNDGSID